MKQKLSGRKNKGTAPGRKSAEDNTERKQTEEELHKSEHRFKALIENAFEGVSIIDAGGKVKYESSGLKNIMGYGPQETIGIEAFKHVHPDDMVKVRDNFGLSIAHPDVTLHLVVRIRHKNGSWRWIECAGRNLLNNPSINGIVINYRDITEHKKTEEERQRLEQQVRQAQKLESLGVLAGGIAHDFNNLLGGIFGFIEMANAESKDSAVSGYLGTALSTIDRARNLTRQLLTFAKGGTPVRTIGSLAPLIREATLFSLSGSNVSCSFDIPDNLPTCNFDRNQIAQVIDNIVINAQQAMPMGGTIRISAASVHLEANTIAMLLAGSYVKVSIADTGIGIPREVLPRIFDPFFTTKQKGSGLGLSTCYSIMMRHDGWIDVESEPGRGSTFYLYLPASGEAPAATPPQVAVVHRGNGRILVMDDDDTVRAAFEKIFMTFGYSVTGTREGKETLRVFTEETKAGRSFAAVILDLTIPGSMGGKETIAEIRKLDTRLPVFVASGYADDPVMANPGKFGFTDCIGKPFRIDELAALLNRHLPVSP
jgi:two-component system, cell cycle sensor histidine kinase and response regulator CckA